MHIPTANAHGGARLVSWIAAVLATTCWTAAQDEPPAKSKSIVLVGDLAGHRVTETFEFSEARFPDLSQVESRQVRFPIAAGELILRDSQSPLGRYQMVYRRYFQPSDPEIDQLPDEYEIKNRILQQDGVKTVQVVASKTFEFSSLQQFRRNDPDVFRQFSDELLFFDALQIFSQLGDFQIIQAP